MTVGWQGSTDRDPRRQPHAMTDAELRREWFLGYVGSRAYDAWRRSRVRDEMRRRGFASTR